MTEEEFGSIMTVLDEIAFDVAQIQQDVDNIGSVVNEVLAKLETVPPPPDHIMEVVVKTPLFKTQVPLQRKRGQNKAGYALWAVYLDVYGRRISPKNGKVLVVLKDVVIADGRNNAYRLFPGQTVDGRIMTGREYIFVRHTVR